MKSSDARCPFWCTRDHTPSFHSRKVGESDSGVLVTVRTGSGCEGLPRVDVSRPDGHKLTGLTAVQALEVADLQRRYSDDPGVARLLDEAHDLVAEQPKLARSFRRRHARARTGR